MDVLDALNALRSKYVELVKDPTTGNTIEKNEDELTVYVIDQAIETITEYRNTLRHKIVNMVNDYVHNNHKDPNTIFITKTVENAMLLLTYNDIGPLINEMHFKGPRSCFSTIFGMKVFWDAEEFKVDYIEEEKEGEGGAEEAQ